MRAWQVERRKRTRHLIELGGLVVKPRVVDLTGDDRATILGALLWMADKLQSDQREHAPMDRAHPGFVERRTDEALDCLGHVFPPLAAVCAACGRKRRRAERAGSTARPADYITWVD